jgi:NADH-quinone oxidoreductase subunit H
VLTLIAFSVKTLFFLFLFIWVRWTVPRFRYDQIMHLGWKVLLPTALAYITVTGTSILVLDRLGLEFGFVYGLILTGVNVVATAIFLWLVDRDRELTGAAGPRHYGAVPRGITATRLTTAGAAATGAQEG